MAEWFYLLKICLGNPENPACELLVTPWSTIMLLIVCGLVSLVGFLAGKIIKMMED